MGLIINGDVYHGATGAASEFGHMNHIPHGPLCRCGKQGCIEAYAADYGIWRAAGEAISALHIKFINPLPNGIENIFAGFNELGCPLN